MPNYLGAAAISPDGTQAWVPSKQDNIKRGTLRDGAQPELPEHRARDQLAHRPRRGRRGLRRAHRPRQRRASRAPRRSIRSASTCSSRWRPAARWRSSTRTAAASCSASTSAARRRASRVSPDGRRLYVNNFMDRTVGVYDLRAAAADTAQSSVPLLATLNAVGDREARRATVLKGKQLFYDARDTRLARDALHELRVLPQRRRPRRPRLGPHRHRRRPAQHDQPARPRRRRRASCTGATTSTRCRTSKARSARSPAARA